MIEEFFPCPSCGFLTFGEPPGSYEICKLCGWEDDHVQLANPSMGGGANKQSLAVHQLNSLEKFPVGVLLVGAYARATDWRPLQPSELESPLPPNSGQSYFEAAAQDAPKYYWVGNAAP